VGATGGRTLKRDAIASMRPLTWKPCCRWKAVIALRKFFARALCPFSDFGRTHYAAFSEVAWDAIRTTLSCFKRWKGTGVARFGRRADS